MIRTRTRTEKIVRKTSQAESNTKKILSGGIGRDQKFSEILFFCFFVYFLVFFVFFKPQSNHGFEKMSWRPFF